MMRKPTPIADLYRWHTAALAGQKPAITHEPECGWFKRRFVRGGPWMPARIWMEQPVNEHGELVGDERMRCEVAGKDRDPEDQWTYVASNPIPESEYRYLMALYGWAEAHAPDHPAANAKTKVDFTNSPIPF